MRMIIYIWLLLSIISANNNDLKYVFDSFINGVPSDDPNDYKIDSNLNYRKWIKSKIDIRILFLLIPIWALGTILKGMIL